MKRWITIGWTGAAAALVVAILAPAGSTATVKKVAFTGTYSGTANVQVNGSVANISANGTGSGTKLGAGSISGTGTGDSSAQPCVPFTGPGTISGSAGKLIFSVPQGAQGCGDEQGQVFAVVGKANVTNGTGTLKKAHGILRFTGTYDRGAGTFSVKFTGTLSQ